MKRQDIFKMRKSKAHKNLVSYGQYGVVLGTALLVMATGLDVKAEEVGAESRIAIVTTEQTATEPSTSEPIPVATEANSVTTEETAPATPAETSPQAGTEAAVAQAVPATDTTPEAGVQSEKVVPTAAGLTTFSWQEVPVASDLLSNSAELLASGATISYKQQPTYGQTTATIIVTYTDGTSVEVLVPIKVTANAIRRPDAQETPVTEGADFRIATGTSPNTSGTVTGTLTSQSATTGLQVLNTINQTTVLDISGDSANYSGGYLEVRITNASALTITPSPLTGVTANVSYSGTDAIIKYTFSPSGLNGGAYYSLKFDYKFKGVDNWGNVVDTLNDNNFTIITTSDFYDKDGLLVKHLGKNTHSFIESKNGANIGTRMSSNQIVGYDLDNDGLVDATNTGKLNFFVHTGILRQDGNVTNDYYAPGTGIFDGRMVNGMGNTLPGGTAIDAVESYTYDVTLVPGTTLSAESKAAGWYEDATGYHLSADRANNPLGGDSTSSLNNSSNFVPLVLDIIPGTPATTITNNKTLSVTGTYTKADGSSYNNTRTTNYSVIIPKAEPSVGDIYLTHTLHGTGDSEIVKPYGRAYYLTNIGLTNSAPVDKAYDLTNYSLRVTTNNDNEFFRLVSVNRTSTVLDLQAGGIIEVYDDATGALLHTFDANNTKATAISEDLKVKTLRYEFINTELEKDSTNHQDTSIVTFRQETFFSDWSTIYNDSSITELTSSTTANLQNDAGSINISQNRTTILERVITTINMDDNSPRDMSFIVRNSGGGFTQSYFLTNTKTGRVSTLSEKATAAYPGQLYQAYLVDPELKLLALPGLEVIYNWNNTGKDLYYETNPVTEQQDSIGQNVVQIANNFVNNGTYEVTQIGFWAEADPGLVPTDGISLDLPINGITITPNNSTVGSFKVILNASEASGVISEVKRDASSAYSFNTNGHQAQDIVDFKINYKNVAMQEVPNVSVITSLPRTGDKQLDVTAKDRNSEFSVYLTGPVTAPAGWEAVYTTTSGTAEQMKAGTWLTADQVTDWSTITAVEFKSTQSVAGNSSVDFFIDNAVIGTDALQGEKAYLSSASSSGSSAFIESNNVLIQIAPVVPDGTVTIKYVNEAGEVIAAEKVLTNDIKSAYDASNQATYYPTNITGTDGLPYVYVETDPTSAPNTGTYSETPQVITHVYKLVEQAATITFVDVTDPNAPVQLGEIESVRGGSGQKIPYDPGARLIDYEDAGYEFVESDYSNVSRFDTDDSVDQKFTIKLKQRVETVTPDKPVNPKTDKELELTRTVTRTIEYKYLTETGEEASATVTQTATFTREATVNMVTGQVDYKDWTSADDELDAQVSPTIPGYTPNLPTVDALTVTADSKPDPVIVIYTPDVQAAKIIYIDDTTGLKLEEVDLTGVTDAKIDYSTADRIAHYENLGYELVLDTFENDPVYDKDSKVLQEFPVLLKQRVETVTPDKPVNPKTKETLELTRTVTRTIEYKYLTETGEEASATVTQTATFTRQATVNMVTGQVEYKDWTSADAELDAQVSPTIPGYTPNLPSVDALTVTADSQPTPVIVVYTPNAQAAKVTYIDETTGETLEVADLTGVTDAKIDYSTADRIAHYENLGYELVSDDYPADATYDKDTTVDQTFTVKLKQRVETISRPVVPNTPVNPDDPNSPVWPESVATARLEDAQDRLIEYRYLTPFGEEAAPHVIQTVTFARTAQVNLVTGAITYTPWTSQDAVYEEVISPVIPGYTANLPKISEVRAIPEVYIGRSVVVYTPDAQAAKVTYIDQTTGQTLEVADLTGVTDAKIDYSTADRIAYYESLGYELVADNFPSDVTYDKDGALTQEFTVVLKQRVETVTPDKPVNPKTNEELELTRTVTRTIEYKYLTETGEEASATVTQTATFTRQATVNMVTGQVTFSDWNAAEAQLPAVVSPILPNYQADKLEVAGTSVTPDSDDSNVVVVYTPTFTESQETETVTRTIKYVDEAGNEVAPAKVETLTFTRPVTTNDATGEQTFGEWTSADDSFDEVSSPTVPNRVTDTPVVASEVVTADASDKEVVVVYTPTSSETTETKTITRTIKYVDEAGNELAPAVTQTVTYTRIVTTNDVTGEQTFGEWTTENADYAAQLSPTVDKYTTDTPEVAPATTSPEDSDSEVTVVYTPTSSETTETKTITRTIKYVDEAGNELAPAVAQTVTYTRTVTTNDVTGEQTFGEWTTENADYAAQPSPTVDKYTTDTPEVAPVTTSPEDSDSAVTVVYTPTSSETTETKTITRTIKYVDETGNEVAPAKVETLTFTRPVTTNDVTGEQTFGEWTSADDSFDEVASPTVPNRVTDTPVVASEVVTADASDKEVVVIYTPTSSETTETKTITRTIKYVDEAGKEVAPSVTQTVTYTRTVKTNDVTGEKTYGEWMTDKADYAAQPSPTVDKYTTDTPEVAPAPTSPEDSDSEVTVVYTPTSSETTETKTITRTIKYVDEAGNEVAPAKVETLTFTRPVTTNDVTGEQTFGEWTSADDIFDEVASPTVPNRVTDTPVVVSEVVTADASDKEVVVVYTPTSSETTETKTITRTIKYVDEAGNELAPAVTQTVTYTRAVTTNDVTGEQTFGEWTSADDSFDEVASPAVPNRVTDTPVVASEVVTADASDKEVVVVYTPTSSETTETKTITRTIKYVDEAGNEVAPSVTQTVTYTRTVKTNDVTGEKTYGEWMTTNKELPAVSSPEVAQHTTDRQVVEALTTTADTADIEEVVVYKKQVQVIDQPEQPSRPNLPSQPAPAPKPEVPAKLDAATGTQVPSAPTQTLPKTGEETSVLSLIGATLLSSFSIFLAKSKKREED